MTQPTTTARASARVPDERGRFGPFGGRFVPETLTRAGRTGGGVRPSAAGSCVSARAGRTAARFRRPAVSLVPARRLTAHCGGAQLWLKREDVNHTGAHKINNTLGQALLTLRMGKQRVIAETGAGQHGVATATACAFRVALRRVHGRRGRAAAGSECRQHAASGGGSSPRDQRLAHVAGCDQRGNARLDGQRRDDPLHPGVRRRPPPVPADRARLSVRDRPRNAAAMPGAVWAFARHGRGLCGRREQRGGHVLSPDRGHPGRAAGRRSRGAGFPARRRTLRR